MVSNTIHLRHIISHCYLLQSTHLFIPSYLQRYSVMTILEPMIFEGPLHVGIESVFFLCELVITLDTLNLPILYQSPQISCDDRPEAGPCGHELVQEAEFVNRKRFETLSSFDAADDHLAIKCALHRFGIGEIVPLCVQITVGALEQSDDHSRNSCLEKIISEAPACDVPYVHELLIGEALLFEHFVKSAKRVIFRLIHSEVHSCHDIGNKLVHKVGVRGVSVYILAGLVFPTGLQPFVDPRSPFFVRVLEIDPLEVHHIEQLGPVRCEMA